MLAQISFARLMKIGDQSLQKWLLLQCSKLNPSLEAAESNPLVSACVRFNTPADLLSLLDYLLLQEFQETGTQQPAPPPMTTC